MYTPYSSLQVLPVQSPCARCFERSKLRMSEFEVRKGLLIKRVLTKKIGTQVVPQIHLTKVQSAVFFYIERRGNGRACSYKTQTISRIPLVVSMNICKAMGTKQT